MKLSVAVASLLGTLVPLAAVETQTWEHSSLADFEKGTFSRLSISSDGRMTLAPAVKEVLDANTTFLWAIARDSRGNIYTGGGALGGAKSKLFLIDPAGRGKQLAELDGLEVQAIAIDKQDRVYAATSPDGKVYRVDANGRADVFYDPKTKYIWALAFAPSGDLFVATGDQGEIHRVTPAGVGSVFFRTEESHARSMAVEAQGNLIVGTEPGGLVIRITPAGEGFVLYQSAKREVTAVLAAPNGMVYAAAVGNRAAAAPGALPAPAATPAPGSAATPPRPTPLLLTLAAPQLTGGSEVYQILPDGYPRKMWSHPQDLAYALALDAQGKPIVATGNNGVVYRIDSDHAYTRLVDLEPSQITALVSAPDGQIWAASGNIGKVFSIGPGRETSGTFESDVLDAGAFTYWGRVLAEPEGAPGVTIESRTGNLARVQRNWSPWASLSANRIASPPARFLQYRLTLSGPGEVRQIYLAHQPRNAAPSIDAVEMTPANYRFPAASGVSAPANPTLTLPAIGRRTSTGGAVEAVAPAMTWAKGNLGVRWQATDENGDQLQFRVEIRGVNETGWKLVRDKVRERYVSFDSTAYPDGRYVIRISANDSPSNPPDATLSAVREADTFQIDNSAPEITGLTAGRTNGRLDLRFHAKDALSWLGKAEYSINGGDWLVVDPTTRLTDSMEHDYRVIVDAAAGESTVAVRVNDEYENQSVAKTVVR